MKFKILHQLDLQHFQKNKNMKTLVNNAELGLIGWIILCLAIGAIPLIFKKNKDKKDQEKNKD